MVTKRNHIPLRKCVVCGNMLPKSEMIRLMQTREGKIYYGKSHLLTGKGIYVCRNEACFNAFVAGRKFRRRFLSHIDADSMSALLENYGPPGLAPAQEERR